MFPANHGGHHDIEFGKRHKKAARPERPKTTLSHDMPLRGSSNALWFMFRRFSLH
jgi:hypothetical protein